MLRWITWSCIFFLNVVYILSVPSYKKKDGAEAQKKIEVEIEKDFTSFGTDVTCKFQPNGNDCDGDGRVYPRFYYDTLLEDCKTFQYAKCPIAFNNFETRTKCHDTCRDPGVSPVPKNLSSTVYCRLQPDFGHCNGYHPMFYYDINLRHCKGFSYSGCGGNDNRFNTLNLCSATCTMMLT